MKPCIMLPEDVLRLIYQKYFEMYVLPELKIGLNTWTGLACPKPFDGAEDLRSWVYARWLEIACRSDDFRLSGIPMPGQKAGNTIGEIMLSFDETWGTDSRKSLVMTLCMHFPKIMSNRFGQVKVVLQGPEDKDFNSFVQTMESHGIQNSKHCVVYRIEQNKAYLVDESGKRTEHHVEYHGDTRGSTYELLPRDQIIPWFRWIP